MFKYAVHSRWSNFGKKYSEDLAAAQPSRDSVRDRAGTRTTTSTLSISMVMVWLPRIFCLSPSSLSMARATTAQKARQNNLQKAQNSHKVTVEEVPDEGDLSQSTSELENDFLHDHDHFHFEPDDDDNWDLNLGIELPDLDCDNISEEQQETDLDKEIVLTPEITEEGELDAFS
ncbi:hypothetical protein DFH07DRAFT_778372 [Mycena maculata]|uniref:Uncharacterized protein n=1 Tax=Mycena maculata TaxID=230809 RepID=A0AAD7N0H2_9AGAR|nr:hypothetical protein DFH07DRAFT_778372 [Mycena maculata]